MNPPTAPVDGVRLALLTSRFDGIVRSMANTLLRTARSGIMNTAHDFSCCIVTAEPALLAMADSLPIHVMEGPPIMAGLISKYHPNAERGDAFLHNSPYEGNSHAADHVILVPVIDDDGQQRFTVIAKGHQADCGNALPTTYSAAARDVYEEGALIFPMVQVQRGYSDINDVVRMCRARIRAPHQWWGDYLALLGAARIGERRLYELADEYGWDALDEYARQWFDYSELLMIEAIRDMPDGTVRVDTCHDPFPNVPDGVPLQAIVTVDTESAKIEIDLRDNPDCLPCGLNLTQSTATSAALIAVFNSLPVEVPHNGGSFRRLRVLLREGCAVGHPRHPASCSVATTGLANRIGGAIQRAIAQLGSDVGMAESGFILNPAMAVISGTDPRDGAPFVNQLTLGHAGGAAGPNRDAWLTIGDHGAGGMLLLDSVEMTELQYPLVTYTRALERDAEGPGRFRGAPGMIVEYGPLDCAMTILFASDGSIHPAHGAAGGGDGCAAWQEKLGRDGEQCTLDLYGEVRLDPGDVVRSRTSGGGGYGSALEREADTVCHDVREGWISAARAGEIYGVVCDELGTLDRDATLRLRAQPSG